MNAAQRGIKLRGGDVKLKGDLDLCGFLGLSDRVPAGYKSVQVEVTLDAPEATPGQLKELHDHVVKTSPVGCITSRPLKVTTRLAS